MLCPINLAISIIKVFEIFLRELKLDLALSVSFVVLVVTILLGSLIHLDEFEEDAILL